MAKKKKKEDSQSTEVEKWLGHISTYERTYSKWESRSDKIIKRYKDDQGAARNGANAKFNILWSNVQTLSAATFSKLPKPDVSRRFKDNDPIGRIASLILERALDYEIQHYKDYRFALKASIIDRFLPGRGTAWVRYEPHFRAAEQELPEDGVEVTEDVDEPAEELDYECAPLDYVHWRDFGHVIARTWDEVPAVWRKVYMTRDALVARFGDDGKKVPLDSIPEEFKQKTAQNSMTDAYRGLIYEIWDKETKQALWLSKSLGVMMDVRDDPLGLEEFFPCPKPLYATLTNESLEPTPDFVLYQDQARELDTLCDRIDGLVKALQVKGCYDASVTALGRLFTEGENTNLIPVKNWAAFAEKQGLKGSVELLDLKPIYEALEAAYRAMEQIKNQVYEITGVSDIIRGQSEANATATAERIKGQFASLRLKAYQEEVAQYAAEAIQIKAQVICNKFDPQTILKISAADQLTVTDADVLAANPALGVAPPPPQMPGMPAPQPQAPIKLMPMEAKKQVVFQAALQLLLGERSANPDAESKNPMRDFRIEIESDSLVNLDDQENKQSRMEFLQAQGNFIGQMEKMILSAGPLGATLIPPLMEMWKFSAQAFKVGKNIEGAIDEASEKMKEFANKPPAPPPPDPALVKVEADAKARQAEAQIDMQQHAAELQADTRHEQLRMQMEGMMEEQRIRQESAAQAQQAQMDMAFERFKALLDAKTKIEVAEISANATLSAAQQSAASAA